MLCRNDDTNTPFDVIVITSPDEESSHAISESLLSPQRHTSNNTTSTKQQYRQFDALSPDQLPTPPSPGTTSETTKRNPVLRYHDGTLFLFSCDPFGARMGSGGGTIAALAEADEVYLSVQADAEHVSNNERAINSQQRLGEHNDDLPRTRMPTVLICHAGGESSRCPSQIALGKAWTSLPVINSPSQKTTTTTTKSTALTTVSNPTSLLISTLSRLFANVPQGSVIVAASDVLLSFYAGGSDALHSGSSDNDSSRQKKMINFENVDVDGVIGVAVPAPLSTATNHGVFVISGGNMTARANEMDWIIQPTIQVLQKPTVDEMKMILNPPCVFNHADENDVDSIEEHSKANMKENSRNHDSQKEPMAWIDTGAIAFLPGSASTLRRMSQTILKCCTQAGLRQMYQETTKHNEQFHADARVSPSQTLYGDKGHKLSLAQFAKENAPRIELYSHFLQALSTIDPPSDARTNYLKVNGGGDNWNHDSNNADTIWGNIYDALSQHNIYTCAVPTGKFVHLGTTWELMDFLTLGSSHPGHTGLENTGDNNIGENVRMKAENGMGSLVEGNCKMKTEIHLDDGEIIGKTNRKRIESFGRSIGLTRRSCSFVSGFEAYGSHSSIVLNSVLINGSKRDNSITYCNTSNMNQERQSKNDCGPSTIGIGSVVEHCQLNCEAKIEIGKRCLISGIRGRVKGIKELVAPPNCRSRSLFRVPSNICLQLLPLKQTPTQDSLNGLHSSFVCICLGVDDRIKDASHEFLFGMDQEYVLERSGLTRSDLWEESIPISDQMIWNAKINPILHSTIVNGEDSGEFDFSFLEWLCCLSDHYKQRHQRQNAAPLSPSAIAGLQQWKKSKRLSISQIRARVDSASEAKYRNSINCDCARDKRLMEISEILLNRRHEPCNFDYAIDFVTCTCSSHACWVVIDRTMATLDSVSYQALAKGQYDIIGRSFMTMSLLLLDILDSLQKINKLYAPSSMSDNSGVAIGDMLSKSIMGLLAPSLNSEVLACIMSVRDALLGSHVSHDASFQYSFQANSVKRCCHFLERAASAMTERCVSRASGGKLHHDSNKHAQKMLPLSRSSLVSLGDTVIASAPARIDLSGGWSDTPPISFEYGGAVACLAVLVDGKRPLRAHCRLVRGGEAGGVVVLCAESKSSDGKIVTAASEVTIRTLGDLADFRNPESTCALLKCALIYLGIAPLDSIFEDSSQNIQPYLNSFCRQSSFEDLRLEITSSSLLPTGSGMGGSSILGGCILASIARCVGIQLPGTAARPSDSFKESSAKSYSVINDSEYLIHAVLMLEQLLTTGGGWQDQIGGLIGGLKLGTSDANVIPLQTKIRRVILSQDVISELNERVILVFTGQPRLAKNILQNVLRRWARRTYDIVDTVNGLVTGASNVISCIEANDLDHLGLCMTSYWERKKIMAGATSGVEPDSVRWILEHLTRKGDIVGGVICGAGGGGFLTMLVSKGKTASDVRSSVNQFFSDGGHRTNLFSWHSCTVAEDGLVVEVIESNKE